MPRLKPGTKYEPLRAWLLARQATEHQIELSFSQIETIIGANLPMSARKHSAWWANETRPTHYHALAWREAGWQVDYLALAEERVVFLRQRAQN